MKIKNLLMLTIILFIGILVINHNVYAEDTTGEETKEEIKWTDTSKSEITLDQILEVLKREFLQRESKNYGRKQF